MIFGDGFQAIFLKCFVCVGVWPRTATLNLFTLVDFYKIYKVLYSTLDIVFLWMIFFLWPLNSRLHWTRPDGIWIFCSLEQTLNVWDLRCWEQDTHPGLEGSEWKTGNLRQAKGDEMEWSERRRCGVKEAKKKSEERVRRASMYFNEDMFVGLHKAFVQPRLEYVRSVESEEVNIICWFCR